MSHTLTAPCPWIQSDTPPEYPQAKSTTWNRAAKRVPDVTLAPGLFIVAQNSSMGDEYTHYEIRQVGTGRYLSCSCKSHMGGESRSSFCTHRMAVSLWAFRQGRSPSWFLAESIKSVEGYGPAQAQQLQQVHSSTGLPANGVASAAPVTPPIVGGGHHAPAPVMGAQNPTHTPCHYTPGAAAGWADPTHTPHHMTASPPAEAPFSPSAPIAYPQPVPAPEPIALPELVPVTQKAQAGWCMDVTSPEYIARLEQAKLCAPIVDHEDPWLGFAPWHVPCIPSPSRWAPWAPTWLKEVRPHQWRAVQENVRAYVERGVQVSLCDMPTGSGKTLLIILIWAELRMLEIPRLHKPDCATPDCLGCWTPLKCLYLATTKQLQDQAAQDFPYAVVLKGKDNYPTANYPEKFTAQGWEGRVSCRDCEWDSFHCYLCDEFYSDGEPVMYSAKDRCPYNQILSRALKADLVICNPAYILPNWNRIGRFVGRFVGWDEGDTLEESLMSAISVEVSIKTQDELGLTPPKLRTAGDTGNGVSSWEDWLGQAGVRIKGRLAAISRELMGLGEFNPRLTISDAIWASIAQIRLSFGVVSRLNEQGEVDYLDLFGEQKKLQELVQEAGKLEEESRQPKRRPQKGSPGRLKLKRQQKFLSELAEKLKGVRESLTDNWVYTGFEGIPENSNEPHKVEFKPVKVDMFAQEFVFQHGRFFLVTSGTLVDPVGLAADLGLQPMDFASIITPSTFPVERRPVYYLPVAANIGKNRQEKLKAWNPITEKVIELVQYFLSQRLPILVHTATYDYTRFLKDALASRGLPCICYEEAGQRIQALDRFCAQGGVLLAPSMERGVNLKDDLCRVQIIVKTPYPYLGDKQISTRYYGTGPSGKTWYARKVVETICQQTGRGMRSETDWCYTYILDKQFESFVVENRRLFPLWWVEGLVAPQINWNQSYRRGRR